MSNGSNFTLDLTGYKDTVGSRVDEGRYRVIVEDAEMDKSRAGNPMVVIWLRILEGEFEGSTLIDRLTLTEKAMFRIVGFLNGLGIPAPRKRINLNTKQFIGRVVDIDVEDGDPYNGRVKSEVRGYVRVKDGAGAAAGAAAAEVDDLDALDSVAEENGSEPETSSDDENRERETVPASSPEEIDLDTLDLG